MKRTDQAFMPYEPTLGRWLVVACCLLGLPATARAGATGWLETSEMLGYGTFQFETAVSVAYDKTFTERTVPWRTPSRISLGVYEAFDVIAESCGLAYDVVEEQGADPTHTNGSEDFSFGLKVQIVEATEGEVSWVPGVGVLALLSTPTGTHTYRSTGVTPRAVVALDWAISDELAVGVNVGVNVGDDEELHHRVQGIGAVGLYGTFADRLNGFAELWGEFPDADRSQIWLAANGGVGWLVTPDVELDVAVNVGLTRVAENLGCGLGLSLRF